MGGGMPVQTHHIHHDQEVYLILRFRSLTRMDLALHLARLCLTKLESCRLPILASWAHASDSKQSSQLKACPDECTCGF